MLDADDWRELKKDEKKILRLGEKKNVSIYCFNYAFNGSIILRIFAEKNSR